MSLVALTKGGELSEFLSAFRLCAKANSSSYFAELTNLGGELTELSPFSQETEIHKLYSNHVLEWGAWGHSFAEATSVHKGLVAEG